ncbi:acriflavin resistance protein [Oryzomicrobium terrae]|uniref:Acriflavin resistance protein n=1 Tax=Oryzomicrobium terrae TaxID=1735038 RepID=A0A5C1E860_9RHOO|nr:multidrug efflux RND transporter permease subunit [Oryzomicrobium terrae]QEL65120.1 acriflavin resistance protein [Oryzomicrobium terrae]
MRISALFIHRPVATTLLTLGIALAGLVAFRLLPVSPLPQVDYPTISVSASLPGASPETMAATVATPLERALGRIAGVSEMTSTSSLGSTRVTLQFDLDRDINGAARDVQAAINAARTLLPTGLPSNPTYRKVNPADAPIMILALTSDTLSQGQVYDVASTIIAQKLSQIGGVGQVSVGGSSLPAVRVELNPRAVNQYGLNLDTVRTALASANVNRPKGMVDDGERQWLIGANDQAKTAKDYLPLIVSYKNGNPVRLTDVAEVVDGVQDLRNAGSANGKPSVLLIINRQPGANIIETIDRIHDELPRLQAAIPPAIDLTPSMDRSLTIRASLREVETTLAIAVSLVILVVFLFLRNGRAALIPTVAVPVSLIGTFAAMYLAGFSLNNLSLMALTIATGFVVDDAIVVLENIARHVEDGMTPMRAALRGAREVGFTVLSMSLSLIAVFIPILLMGDIVGRLFREFAVTLSVAILISLLVSLTTTPMMCARLLKRREAAVATDAEAPAALPSPALMQSRWRTWLARLNPLAWQPFVALQAGYRRTLGWALDHSLVTILLLAATVALNVHLYIIVPKGLFPQQDTGRIMGFIRADQSISFQAMRQKLADFIEIVRADPAVDTVVGFTGGSRVNSGSMFLSLKPLRERGVSADQVINRLRGKLAKEPGANLVLFPAQDIRIGGRQSSGSYDFTIKADELGELRTWEPRIRAVLSNLKELEDVNTDLQDKGLQTTLSVDRDALARTGITMSQLVGALGNAYSQRQVSTIYSSLNQYKVVMEVAPPFWQSPEALRDVVLIGPSGTQVPLSTLARWEPTFTPLGVEHDGQFVSSTVSFNLAEGVSLSQASAAVKTALAQVGVPTSIQAGFEGSAKQFQSSQASQLLLILAALITMYIVLGMLYESFIHPLTILSTLPSAGVGALLALMAFKTEFGVIALIGVLLLIGIVKKNAIMMIDVALATQRRDNLSPREAIFRACLLRFRPIMMTTLAAILGAVPLALGHGDGAELRQPLGIAIVGGLIVSQLLTLYTTPVVYVYLDRFGQWGRQRLRRLWRRSAPDAALASGS